MYSMTGFGRAEGQAGPHHFTVEVRSVNHRYLDIRFRLPGALSQHEVSLTECLKSHFERGAFEVSIRHKISASSPSVSGGTRFVVDEGAARSLNEACDWLHAHLNTPKSLSIETFMASGRVFLPIEESADQAGIQGGLKQLLEAALLDLKSMRQAEGQKLKVILKEGVDSLLKIAERLSMLAPDQPLKIKEKLEARLSQWKLTTPIDTQRLEWEVALFADRADITEEIDRLRAHGNEFGKLLEEKKSVGRKLDFLTQELHREVNTVGSKANFIEITRLTVEAKTAIEKLREQVQNVE